MKFDPTTIIGFETNELRAGKHSRDEIESMVRFHLPDLEVPKGEDGFAIVMTICGIESDFGQYDPPKFEAYYSRSSISVYKKDKILQTGYSFYGDACACSYGPFQILWYNAALLGYPMELSPLNLWSPVVSLPFVIEYLNRCFKYGAQTAMDLFAQYNGGWGVLKSPGIMKSAQIQSYLKKANAIYPTLRSKGL